MLKAIARTSFRRRKTVLLTWLLLVLGLFAIAQFVGTGFRTEFGLPGSESQRALDVLEEEGFISRTGAQGQIVVQTNHGIQTPRVQESLDALFAAIEQDIEGLDVVSPYEPGGERQINGDGTIAYAELNFSERSQEAYADAAAIILDRAEGVSVEGLNLEFGGEMFLEPPPFNAEFVGIIAAIIILLVAFGSLLAMGLPIVTALFGVAAGVAIVLALTRFTAVPGFTTPAVAMVGIGVGIDYALLIVTRFRESLHDGHDAEGAAVHAIDTAGRAAIFAGLTVVIAVLGLLLMQAGMGSVAFGISAGVLMVMLASVTLLPALLGFVGNHIDRFGLPHRARREGGGTGSFWRRWSRVIQRYPLPSALAGLAILIVLTLPVFAMRLGFSDAGNRPESDTTRRAYDLLSEGFGPGVNGPLVLAAELPGGAEDLAALSGLHERLLDTPGVAAAAPPHPNDDGSAALMLVFPTTSPQDEATTDLIHHLRDEVIPNSVAGTSASIHVGGATAAAVDFSEYSWEKMPIFFGAVLLLSFLLLMLVFRSVLVPLKAVILNLLSIGAAFGVLVAVFQWGWGAPLLGIGKEGPIEAWAPMMMFAVVFGLSMDYEVFLLSRIREEYTRSGDNASAVADGLAATARVITAAAAIMVCVFGSFTLGDDHSLKILGLGLAVAIFVDATLVRLILVPATMELLGHRNWWLPGWLNRRLPAVHVEGAPEPVAIES